MNATETKPGPDLSTLVAELRTKRDALAAAVETAREATAALRDGIIRVRPLGLLTVDEMTEAVARDRNYVDSVWSTFGATQKGKQTRVAVENADPEVARTAYDTLHKLADDQRRTTEREKAARAERDALVASVYAAKTLGPSAIAAEVGVDRNHVLRIARRAGIKPQHRKIARNQYTAK